MKPNDPNELRRVMTTALAWLALGDVIWALATFSNYPRSSDDWEFIAEGVIFPLFTIWFVVWTILLLLCGWNERPKDEAVRLRRGGWYILTLCLALLPSFTVLDALSVMVWRSWPCATLAGSCTLGVLVLLCVSWRNIKKAAAYAAKLHSRHCWCCCRAMVSLAPRRR